MNKFVIALICVLTSSLANAKAGGHSSGGHNVSARGQDVVYAAQSAKLGLELPVGPIGSVHR